MDVYVDTFVAASVAVRSAMATLALLDPDPAKRLGAAEQAFAAPDPEAIGAIDTALGKEKDVGVVAALTEARAAVLASDARPPKSSPPSISSPPTAAPTRSSSAALPPPTTAMLCVVPDSSSCSPPS